MKFEKFMADQGLNIGYRLEILEPKKNRFRLPSSVFCHFLAEDEDGNRFEVKSLDFDISAVTSSKLGTFEIQPKSNFLATVFNSGLLKQPFISEWLINNLQEDYMQIMERQGY